MAPAEAPAVAPAEAPAVAPVEAPAVAPAEVPTVAPAEVPVEAAAIAPARRHAASRPGTSSARITPRLADIARGFTTQGNGTPSSCGPRGRRISTRLTAGIGSPAADSAARAKSLRRVILAAEGALCASPRAAAARFAISTVASSVATTAAMGRSRCAETTCSMTAPASAKSTRIPPVIPGTSECSPSLATSISRPRSRAASR